MRMIRNVRENLPFIKPLIMITLFCRRDKCDYSMDVSYCRWCYRHSYDYCTCGECYENKDYIDGK